MQIALNTKAALVTGSARGIGFAIAEKLLAAGACVVLCDIDGEHLEQSRVELEGKYSGRVDALSGDLTKPDFARTLVDRTLERFGSLDILVNNAGYTWDSVIQKTTDEQFQAMLEIHVAAPFRILRAAAGWLRETAKRESEQGTPRVRKVVNITSISGLDGNPGQSGYASAKAAIVGLTKTLAKEWGRYQVTVNAVGFGLIDTRLTKAQTDAETKARIGNKEVQVGMRPETRAVMEQRIPLGRFGSTEDAANAVFFFCSPLSDYVTGEVLVCGGGLHF